MGSKKTGNENGDSTSGSDALLHMRAHDYWGHAYLYGR